MSRWILIGGAGLTGLKIAEDLIDRNIPNSKIIIADLKDSLEKININTITKTRTIILKGSKFLVLKTLAEFSSAL